MLQGLFLIKTRINHVLFRIYFIQLVTISQIFLRFDSEGCHGIQPGIYFQPMIHLIMSIAFDLDLEVNVSLPGGLVSSTQT